MALRRLKYPPLDKQNGTTKFIATRTAVAAPASPDATAEPWSAGSADSPGL